MEWKRVIFINLSLSPPTLPCHAVWQLNLKKPTMKEANERKIRPLECPFASNHKTLNSAGLIIIPFILGGRLYREDIFTRVNLHRTCKGIKIILARGRKELLPINQSVHPSIHPSITICKNTTLNAALLNPIGCRYNFRARPIIAERGSRHHGRLLLAGAQGTDPSHTLVRPAQCGVRMLVHMEMGDLNEFH